MTTWGIDFSTKAVSFATSEGKVSTLHIPSHEGAERLWRAHSAVTAFARSLVKNHPPFAVFVEQPFGRVHPNLHYMTGVIQCAIYGALEHWFEYPVSVVLIRPDEWRKALGLERGRRAEVKLAAMQWAKAQGYTPNSGDEADALAIAAAGERMVSIEAA